MRYKILLIVFALVVTNIFSQNSIYNVKELISQTEKTVLITSQLQALIDRCSAEGGGYIYFPAGDYLTGTIVMKDNTYLDLSPGATIYGSTDINDYPDFQWGKSLIYAAGAKNFGVIGQGTLNGNGDFFWRGKERPYIRPDRFILFVECQNIRMNGITMLNSPSWNLEVLFCDFVWIDGVSMISDMDSPNSDGIDPTSSSHVFISNCYFELGDDAICPKSRGTKPTEFIVVENCIIRSDDSAIKLGTRSEAPIRNLVFSNIIIKDTQYGIAFFAKDGGTFENIRFSNITIESARNENSKNDRPSGSYPIFLDIERRNSDSPISFIKDIHFSDISINSKDGHCLFLGQPDQKIENLYFSNITFNLEVHRTFAGSKKPRGVRTLQDRAANDFSHIPSNFTFAYVKNLRLNNLDIRDVDSSGLYERHMIWGYDVQNVQVSGFTNSLITPNKELAQFKFKDAASIEINGSRPTASVAPFLFLEGKNTSNVLLLNNNFRHIKNIVKMDAMFNKSELVLSNNLNRK
ncbi:right-handed parallel beta-helix repeat-containing protein [candidate division KSB1 bacterium]|nr:right-handed parallel beta-helix repeat-containing protein [candidate division KSB1 bacterium]